MTDQRTYTPRVQAEARRLGVDLSSVCATGAGGRVRLQEVYAAAPRRVERWAAAKAPAAAGRRPSAVAYASRFNSQVQVTLDPYGRNPLLEDLRQALPDVYAIATRQAPPPTLFEVGDLPPFTASGVDPAVLLDLPWHLRHEAAAATSAGTVLALLEATAHDPDGYPWGAPHVGVTEYVNRMTAWAAGRQSLATS